MACKDCNDECKWNIFHVCRVCELLDGDTSKKRVCYCTVCKHYLCKSCKVNPLRRVEAAVDNVTEKIEKVATSMFDSAFSLLKGKRKKKEDITDEFGKEDETIIKPSTETDEPPFLIHPNDQV